MSREWDDAWNNLQAAEDALRASQTNPELILALQDVADAGFSRAFGGDTDALREGRRRQWADNVRRLKREVAKARAVWEALSDDDDEARSGPRKSGPEPLVTPADVRDAVARLAAEGRPHGHKSVALALGVSESTVKRTIKRGFRFTRTT